MLKLRLIQFFDRSVISLDKSTNKLNNHSDIDQSPKIPIPKEKRSSALDMKNVSAWCGSPFAIWLGDTNGFIHWFSNDYKVNTIKAFDQEIKFMKFSSEKELLMCIGNDTVSKGGTKYRVFSITFSSPSKMTILDVELIREGPIFSNRGFVEQELTCFDIEPEFKTFALGTEANGFAIFRGDITKPGSLNIIMKRDKNSKILNVYFVKYQGELRLFVCTANRISSYSISNSGEIRVVYHDDIYDTNSYLNCLNNHNNCLLVWRQEAVFTYHPHEGNLSAIPCDGEGLSLSCHSNYFVAVSKEYQIQPEPTAIETHLNNQKSKQQRQSLHIFLSLPELRLIAFKCLLEDIHCLVSGMQSIFILTSNKAENDQIVVHKLHEKSILERIDSLIKKRLFEWASLLAIREKQPPYIIQEIYLQHGDSLFLKEKYDQALSVYMETIGHTDPSYIIDKYLSAHRIRNLSEYLLQLHRVGHNIKEHTIMLFKCYTSLQEKPKIEEFTALKDFKNYDLRSVIMECRQSGYCQLALDLSKFQDQHDLYVTILIEDFIEIDQAMKYMRSISAPIACTLIVKFGRTLIKDYPIESLNLIYEIMDNNNLGIEVFLPLFVNRDELLLEFLSRYINLSSDDGVQVMTTSPISLAARSTAILTFLELLLRQWKSRSTKNLGDNINNISNIHTNHIGIKHRFTKFTEMSQPDLNRLIMKLLRYHFISDEEFKSALKLCLFYSFEPGIIYCTDKIFYFQIPLSLYLKNENVKELLNYCSTNSLADSILWTQALTYISTLSNPESYLGEILRHIKAGNLLPPLAVLNILSNAKHISCDEVKDYLLESFEDEKVVLDASNERLLSLFQDHNSIKQKLSKVNQSFKHFVSTNCSQCHLPLEYPSLHFCCGHSYHIYCVATESVCQKCEPLISSRKLMKEQRQFKMENYDEFFKYLRGSNDGLEYISNHFGKGMFHENNNL